MLRAVGFGDGDFDKPIVGIANACSTITPCNAGLDILANRIDAGELLAVERNACGGIYTAHTTASTFEAMGLSLQSSSTMAAEDAEKADSAARSAKVLVKAIQKQILPAYFLTRKAFENTISVVIAVGGGTTNAVLHLLATAQAMRVDLSIDDFETISRRVPVLGDMKPSGRYAVTDLHRAGGIPQL